MENVSKVSKNLDIDIEVTLSRQGYYVDKRLALAIRTAVLTRPVAGAFLFGPPGAGKSTLPQAIAAAVDFPVVFYQVFPGTREDDLIVKLIPDAAAVSGIKTEDGPLTEAARLSAIRPVVLVLDEWDKARPAADAFLLDFLQAGRLRFNGVRLQANLCNMLVFITSNEERELSEPLLRRLPRVDIPLLPTEIVRRALNDTHAGHPQLNAALALYQRSITAGMQKPVTIQELRQLLDAIDVLGAEADWNTLVYQFVTKSPDDHATLSEEMAKKILMASPSQRLPSVNPDDWGISTTVIPEAGITLVPRLPRPQLPAVDRPPRPEKAYGFLKLTPDTYTYIANMHLENKPPPRKPDRFPGTARVVQAQGEAWLELEVPLTFEEYARLHGDFEGEVMIVLPSCPRASVMALTGSEPRSADQRVRLVTWTGWKIIRLSEREIVLRAHGTDLRWTPERVEIITRSDDSYALVKAAVDALTGK